VAKTFRFEVGGFECVSISDGYQPIGAELLRRFFAGAPLHELHQAFRKHGIEPEYMDLACNCLLIDTGACRVLVDTGGGPFFDPHLGNLVPGLQAEGINPQDINIVVLSHGHRDHVGGCIDRNGGQAFPNARYVMARGEWEHWTNEPDETALDANTSRELSFVRDNLLAIEDRLHLLETDAEIVHGIRVFSAPGHTRHHVAVEATSQNKHLICVADAMDHPIHVEHVSWHAEWDELAEQGIETRRNLLMRAVGRAALVHAYHFPFPGVGFVREDAAGWCFESLKPGNSI